MSAKPTDSACGKGREASRYRALKASAGGVALSVALILSYVEAVLPLNIGVPGIKLGLANIAVLFILYKYGFGYSLLISVLRVVLASLLFGNMSSFIYSISGALISIGVMALLKKTDTFSPVGVSVAGGICHNLGQVCAAAVLLDTSAVAYYIPVLVVSGVLCGAVIGLLGGILIKKLRFQEKGV